MSGELQATPSCRIQQNPLKGEREKGRGLCISFHLSQSFRIMNKIRVRHDKSEEMKQQLLGRALHLAADASLRGSRSMPAVPASSQLHPKVNI